ncbi:radical SAM family heme chaperone HemW [Zongyangia hominis]|uniref:Heme chaperone HemW n=1 Tax=Zongyangia hominis TaxID=2763677 RepID=A0A926IBK4_9FIRM|nr:radical SAM family heme chaperone HemW [Zongyangia hominis]MBC8570378.1 radical SAM family heme chaperone HemW [Zongyangia hominis]
MSEPIGLYLHVPFCRSKCPYCDFYSVRGDGALMDAYTDALLRQISTAPPEAADSVYFGGGTPTLLGKERLGKILAALSARFSLTHDCEITTEANPRAAEGEVIAALGSLGFTRASFGMQSADERELSLLGRRHSRDEVARSVEGCRAGGVDNISLDVMLGVIGQTSASLRDTLDFALSLSPAHLSAYILKVEAGTPYDAPRFRDKVPDEDAQADLYLETVRYLSQHGLCQYEISNFARPGMESRHNLKYWRCRPYLGFGPAAHSYYGGMRFAVLRDLRAFCRTDDFSRLPFTEVCEGGGFFEELMLGLRLNEGVDLDALSGRYALDLSPLKAAARPLCARGLAVLEDGRLSLTPEGFLVSNAVIAALLDAASER